MGEANHWNKKETWLIASITYIQSGEYKTLVRKFKKANASNAFQAWMNAEGVDSKQVRNVRYQSG